MVTLLNKYLDKNGYSNQKESLEDLFLSHPNYPSLFAITDSLNLLSIENIAIKVPKEQFLDLPDNFLAVYDNNIVLVHKNSTSITIETDGKKKQKLNFDAFLSAWNQIIIAIEPNVNPVLKKNKRNVKSLLYVLPFIGLIIMSATFNTYTLNSILLLTSSLIGLLFSVFIVQEKFGIKNEVASKFCNINPNVSCNSVIKSTKSEINKWVGLSDLPFLFFSISTVSILWQPKFADTIGFFSLVAIPAIVYSVWLQKFELKKWCVLCLAVSFVIVIQGIAFGFNNITLFNYSITSFAPFLFSSILLTSIWFSLKPFVVEKLSLEKQVNELNRFKRNFNFFQFLSKNIEEHDDFEKLNGITFGDKNVTTQITLILSPSCGHCHTTFKEAYELFQKFPDKLYLNILFNINPENNDNPYKTIVENLLALNEQNPQKAKEAIVDWHINRLDLKNWKRKWTVETPHLLINKELKNQYYWCVKNEFNYTPVKIINDNLFPEEYDITDLKYFINDFQEEMENEKSLKVV
jgi:uncharacterized membrane protein